MEFKDYYKVMGVAEDATQDEIKRAYRKLARKYHPDVSKEADAEDRFKEVGEAYEVLKDPEKRAAYDNLRQGGYQSGQEFHPPPGWDSGFEFSGGGFTGADAAGFSDFFESLFGAGSPFGAGGGARGTGFRGAGGGGFSMRGQDHHARIQIALDDAFRGVSRTVTLQVPEVDAQGHVHTKQHSLNVKIPAGITAGQQIRLAGQGAPGMGGGERGDLYLEIQFAPHPLYQVEGRDVYLTLPIAPWEAALGAKLQVPTLGGAVEMKIPAGAQSGQKLRLKGRGLPGKTPGDQYLILQVRTPPARSEEDRELYETMAKKMNFDPRANLTAAQGG